LTFEKDEEKKKVLENLRIIENKEIENKDISENYKQQTIANSENPHTEEVNTINQNIENNKM
jgi:hypothetical protein